MATVIELANVTKKFKFQGKDLIAVNDVSFFVKGGEIFGLLGPNGAGKTTTLNIIVGMLTPDAGTIRLFGKEPGRSPGIMERVSLTSGGSSFHGNLRVIDILQFYGRVYGLPTAERERRIARLISFFDLTEKKERKFWYLSTGEKMRLTFAKALLNEPALLLLDEPTLGLDPDIALRMREEILRINRKFKTTILLTSHYMHEVEQLCDRIGFMSQGALVDVGTIDAVTGRQFSTYDVRIEVTAIKDREFLRRAGFLVKGNVLHVKVPTDDTITTLLAQLVRRGFEIRHIETRRPTLEDYFVKMTGRRRGIA